ncbi:MAG: hypothetical protein ABSC53_12180 [Bacteroidota bacterium]
MNSKLVEQINREIPTTQSASFAESVRVHLDYLEPKLVGFDKLAKKLLHFIKQPQQFCDFLTEAHWALSLLCLGVIAEYEPLGESGPDIRVQHSDSIVDFHCKRLRNDLNTAEKLENYNDKLIKYGNVQNDTISIFERITSEQPQRIDISIPQIVAYWSDSERVEEHEFKEAIDSIQTATVEGRFHWISGVIYKVRIFKHFEHWYNPYSSVRVPGELKEILQRLQPWPTIAKSTL